MNRRASIAPAAAEPQAGAKLGEPPLPMMYPNREWTERYERWHHRWMRRPGGPLARPTPDTTAPASAPAVGGEVTGERLCAAFSATFHRDTWISPFDGNECNAGVRELWRQAEAKYLSTVYTGADPYLLQVVRKLSRAQERFIEVHADSVVTGSTEYERRASEGEIADRAAEVLHQELSDFGFVEISAVLEAITTVLPPRADAAADDVAALRWTPIEHLPFNDPKNRWLLTDGEQVLIGGRSFVCTGQQTENDFWTNQPGSGFDLAFKFKPIGFMDLPDAALASTQRKEG